jgi:hypothetical protein
MNHNSPKDSTTSSLSDSLLKWIVGTILLTLFYFGAGPWIVLVLCAINEKMMNSNHPLGIGLEWSMYPAILLAENVDFYNEYFWDVLAPLGG